MDFFYISSFMGAFKEERAAHYFYPSVRRPFDVICLRTKGQACFYSDGREYTVRSGQVILIPRGVEYAQRGEVDECIIAIHFSADRLPNPHICVYDVGGRNEIRSAFEDIWERYQKNGYTVDAGLLSRLYALLEAFMDTPEVNSHTKFDRILAAFEAYYNSVDFSVGQWAELLGISRTHLQNLCLIHLHTAPCAYLQQRRIEDAKKILLRTDYKIKEVSKMCGYYSDKRFSTAFASYVGVSPAEYRKRERAGTSNG